MYCYCVWFGIIGWVQVNGYCGEMCKVEVMEVCVKFDLFYMQNWSFWFDIKIILMMVVCGFIGCNVF